MTETETSLEELLEAAKGGDREAQYEVGLHYARLDPPDHVESQKWLLESARRG